MSETFCHAVQVDYQTPAAGYPYLVSLVGPPLLLQTRVERTEHCGYALGNEFNHKVWDTTVNGVCVWGGEGGVGGGVILILYGCIYR